MRPILYFAQTRGYRDTPRLARVVPVADLDDAIRAAAARCVNGYSQPSSHAVARRQAGRSWWLVAGWTEREAHRQALFLHRRQHARQADFEAIHAAIAHGLDPDLTPLREDDVFWDRPIAPALWHRPAVPATCLLPFLESLFPPRS